MSARSYLAWDSVEILSQHPPHVLASVRRHLVLEQEGEVAALADAVKVAVDLVVLTPWEERRAVNDPTHDSVYLWTLRRVFSARGRRRHQTKPGEAKWIFFFLAFYL